MVFLFLFIRDRQHICCGGEAGGGGGGGGHTCKEAPVVMVTLEQSTPPSRRRQGARCLIAHFDLADCICYLCWRHVELKKKSVFSHSDNK